MKRFFTSSAFLFCIAVNCVVISVLVVVALFPSTPFAEVDDWSLLLEFLLAPKY